MHVVGMVSSYREGRLAVGAIDSLHDVGLDRLYVYEGPAGPPLEHEADCPPTQVPTWADFDDTVVVHRGRWRTDARKRNEMLQRAKADFPGSPLWAVVVDADEVLVNGVFLRDRLNALQWDDERKGVVDTAGAWARWPLHLVETDGSIAIITARVFRADLLRSIDHSSSVVTNAAGVREGWGNHAERSKLWIEGWLRAIDEGKMIAWPPLPAEPHLVHRSHLRHPLRRGLRMSDQEAVEFAKAQAAERAAADGNGAGGK